MSSDEFPFSFHCIICFDAFNLDDRPPVVLPCGHTYICMPCGKRLKRCMECRTSLYYTPPNCTKQNHRQPSLSASPARSSARGVTVSRYGASRRYGHGANANTGVTNPPSQDCKPEPIPLPLPKNLLMMSLMEAAQRQSKAERRGVRIMEGEDNIQGNLLSFSTEEEDPSFDCDDDGNDDDKIKAGFSALSSPFGTYAVTERAGLTVLPYHPDDKENEKCDGIDRPENDQGPIQTHPFQVHRGQLLQVVDVKDNIVKLAREKGYVVASNTQLVKVSGPQDKVCEIEGMLQSVSKKERELQSQMEKMKQIRCGLELQLKRAFMEEDEHPVITSPQFTAESFEDDNTSVEHPDNVHTTPRKQPLSPGGHEAAHHIMASPPTSPAVVQMEPHSPCVHASPNTIDNSDLCKPKNNQVEKDDYYEPLAIMNCSSIFGNNNDNNSILLSFDTAIDSSCGFSATQDSQNRSGAGQSSAISAATAPSDRRDLPSREPNATRQQLVSSHSMNSPSFSHSFDNIDFRTGMSGHRALTNSKSHADQHTLESTRAPMRLMSQHGGVFSARSLRRNRLLMSATGAVGGGDGDNHVSTLNTFSRWMKSNPRHIASHGNS